MSSPPLCNLGTTSTIARRPDEKMGRPYGRRTSAQRKTVKRNAAKKRRAWRHG